MALKIWKNVIFCNYSSNFDRPAHPYGAYSGSPVPVPNRGRVSPQLLSHSPLVPPPGSNGSVVAYYAKESSKQLASGIVTLGDVGYKKLSRYYSDLLPNASGTMKQGNLGFKANGVTNGHTIDSEYAGMVRNFSQHIHFISNFVISKLAKWLVMTFGILY